MISSYSIRYLRTAEKDLIDIFDYIGKDNPSAARSQLEQFDHSISLLATNPYLGVTPKDERLKILGYRLLVVGKYIAFYVVKPRTVQIRRVIHGARQYDFLL